MIRKHPYLIILLILPFFVFTSCKDEFPKYEPPENTYYFTATIDDVEKSLTNGVNGYRTFTSCYSYSDANGLYSTYIAGFTQGAGYYIQSKESLTIMLRNGFTPAGTTGNGDFITFLQGGNTSIYSLYGVDTAITDTLSISGVEFIWVNSAGQIYRSGTGQQTGSNFVVTTTMPIDANKQQIKATFNVFLYNQQGEMVMMKDGEVFIHFEDGC